MSTDILIPVILKAFLETFYIVSVSGIIGTTIGLPIGIFLATSRKNELFSFPIANKLIGLVVNALRSVPFIILVIAIIPFTRLLTGTSIGTKASVVPLTISAIPFIARLIETSIREVNIELVETARSMGATPLQIITKVLLAEAKPGIILSLTVTMISLIGYSAMVGAVGGGGLGDLAIRYGYQRFMPDVMLIVVFILIIIVQVVQSVGNAFAKRFDKRSRNN
ncbi:Methionine ABC transporter permease protein [Liberibacter crescens BT-1]|uniref:Methionine ABC transporter permease protein n=1 Tax=Liberibacter crescens (strain BT-1) TaxID=1215343 RepID=L0EVT5_LIBCB|nr:methionine ABC transporter permease [Liberibacter crescens]AGA65047.1 Methionine ABC transporter permease protein [Liberibacter crescens BT-1]AMC13045.1 DL-methionine transporter permease subunit [Liberibacter crescens]